MASEMRRMARALVEHRTATFVSRHGREESESRLKSAMAAIEPRRLRFECHWNEGPEGLALDAQFHPAPHTPQLLQLASLALVALVAASAWVLFSNQVERTTAFVVTLAAALGLLAFPLAMAALGALREAEEARIRRALRRALTDDVDSGGGRSR